MSGGEQIHNSENNDYSEHIYGKGKGTHFSREELFAYLHQSNRNDDVWKVMHQHMLNCSACRAEVAELEQAVHVLKRALSPQNNASYESITVPVMKLIHEQQQTGERRWFGMPSSGYLPLASVAIIVVVLCAIMFGSMWFMHTTAATKHTLALTPVSTIGGIPQQYATVIPTVKPTSILKPTVGTTVIPQRGTLLDCTTSSDIGKQHLHICGSNFIAGDNIVFTLVDSKGRPMKGIGPVQVQSDGTFSQNIFIRSCKDVPSVIYALDTSIKSTEGQAIMSNIQYGNCQVGVSINQVRSNR